MIKLFKNKKIKIYFIAQYKAGSDKFYSVVKEMEKDESIDVKVLAVPNDITDLTCNKDYEYWKNLFGDITINSIENNNWYNLEKDKPDYVFIQRPYDMYVPDEYKKETMIKYTRICYIPYGFSLVDIFDISFKPEDAKNIDIIFAEHEEVSDIYKKTISKIDDDKKRISICLGYPSLDESIKKAQSMGSAFNKIEKRINTNVLWTPRWTTDKTAVETSFFDYKDCLVDYCKKNKNINLVFRPHPLAFKNFIEKKEMTEKEVKEYLSNFKENLYYDNSGEYLNTFKDTDILITDFSSIIPEFFLFNKPVIFTQKDTYKKLKYLEKLEKVFYKVKNKKELFKILDDLQKGIDPLKEKRKELAKKILKDYDGKVAYRIKEYIKEDYKNK